MDPSKFLDWWSAVMGAIGGAFTAIIGFWLTFSGRIHKLEESSKACLIHRGMQGEQHTANQLRLLTIESDVKTIEGDVKAILKILLERK